MVQSQKLSVQFKEAHVKELEERILRDGRVLGGGILKVDSFVNHQVDPLLMDACGREFARLFASVHATKVLTAEISGIAPAVTTAIHLGLPVVYARKTKPITMPDQVYLTLAPSHTKGRMVELIVSPEYLANDEKVLIIDDFLASGQTILGLARLAEAAGSRIVGIGALIEKIFEGGREALKPLGVPIHSLACITAMEGDKVVFGQPS
jgi:xanthine phosphoribosyltransferase